MDKGNHGPENDSQPEQEIVTFTIEDDTATAVVRGEVDIYAAPVLGTVFVELLENPKVNKLTIDLQKVTYFDSPGLGQLIIAFKTAKKLGKITNFISRKENESVNSAIEITGLDKVFDIEYK